MKNSSQAKSKALFILTLAIFIASASFYFNNPETISHSTEEPELVYRALSHHDAKSESFTPVKNEELSRFRLSLEEARSQGGGLIHGRFSSKVPYHNRWRNRFNAVKARNGSGGIFFFRHIRKVFCGIFILISIDVTLTSSFESNMLCFIFAIFFILHRPEARPSEKCSAKSWSTTTKNSM